MRTSKRDLLADLLLCAAKHWQNFSSRDLCCGHLKAGNDIVNLLPASSSSTDWASVALTQVEWGLGIETEDN
jgi:hypothetical protein